MVKSTGSAVARANSTDAQTRGCVLGMERGSTGASAVCLTKLLNLLNEQRTVILQRCRMGIAGTWFEIVVVPGANLT